MDDLTRDLVSSENKYKINEYIRKEKLSEAALDKLWDIEYFRWGIIRNQKLSEDRITLIINDVVKKKIKDGNKLLSYLIKYQSLNNNHYNEITSNEKIPVTTLLNIWNTNPKEAYQYGNYERFLKIVGDEHHLSTRNRNKFIKSINHFCKKTKKINDVLDTILSSYDEIKNINDIAEVLVRENFIEDDYVNRIRNVLGEDKFKKIAELIILRGNCSISMKAKLLLLK